MRASLFVTTLLCVGLGTQAYAAKPKKSEVRTSDAELEAAHLQAGREALKKRRIIKPNRLTHYRANRSKALQLNDTISKHEVTVIEVKDGQVLFHGADATQVPKGGKIPVSRAEIAPDAEQLLRTKVGQRVTLHFQRDALGVAYVTRVTRPEAQ